jgi:hypothetical protein
MTVLKNGINLTRIGMATEMSEGDILATNKAYSCGVGPGTLFGGGNQKV